MGLETQLTLAQRLDYISRQQLDVVLANTGSGSNVGGFEKSATRAAEVGTGEPGAARYPGITARLDPGPWSLTPGPSLGGAQGGAGRV